MQLASFTLLLLRGDHILNEFKASKIIGAFRFATNEEIEQHMRCRPGYIGPVGIDKCAFAFIADRTVPPQ